MKFTTKRFMKEFNDEDRKDIIMSIQLSAALHCLPCTIETEDDLIAYGHKLVERWRAEAERKARIQAKRRATIERKKREREALQ